MSPQKRKITQINTFNKNKYIVNNIIHLKHTLYTALFGYHIVI